NLLADESKASFEIQYELALSEISAIEAALLAPLEVRPPARKAAEPVVRSNFEKADYLNAVEKSKEYIAAGDIFQVVLSQRFQLELPVPPFDVYRALRIVNPSPYMYFLKMEDTCIVGSSPEMLVKIHGREIEYRPIAGTQPRGQDEAADEQIARTLAEDPKERAE